MAARTIVEFIRECRANGKTVIFSTHVMSEVEKLCDRIGIIHGGQLLAEGTLAELRERYGMQDLEDIFVKSGRVRRVRTMSLQSLASSTARNFAIRCATAAR